MQVTQSCLGRLFFWVVGLEPMRRQLLLVGLPFGMALIGFIAALSMKKDAASEP